MSIDNLQELEDPTLFNAKNWIGEFQEALESSSNINLLKWASEVPEALRGCVVPKLLQRYFETYREKGWTVQLADFVERFPEFEPVVHLLNVGPTNSPGVNDTVTTSSLTATTRYEVDDLKWKEGGQGVIHKAVEGDIGGRKVVVKYLKDGERTDDFRKEIEVTARLEHPGVAAVFTHGVEDTPQGRPFYAMRLIHGKSLEDRIAELHNRVDDDGNPIPVSFVRSEEDGIVSVLDCIVSACHTVAHAHRAGVLHCDLKPKNIVCGDFQATIVLDWGSAQSYDIPGDQVSDSTPPINLPGDTSHSHTAGYASPEQIEQGELTPASDVFCLGATLYHALTGKAPFGNHRKSHSECPRPRRLNRHIHKRLEAVCLKAMRPAPKHRYQSVEELARDLNNWLRDEEVAAAPDTWLERAFRVARHHKQATAIAAFAMFALMTLGIFAWNVSIDGSRASESLGSAFNLIEDLCRPLEDDAVANSSEFDRHADEVARFASSYINENPKDEKLGRAHELAGLVAFYRHNRTGNNDKLKNLDRAIVALQNAEAIYRANDSKVDLAHNLVRQARWMRKLAETDSSGYEHRETAFKKLIAAITIIKDHGNRSGKVEAQDRVLAEAYQTLGELVLRNKSALVLVDDASIETFAEGQNERVIRSNLEASVRFFSAAIDLLTPHNTSQNCRNLARGYGWRGDSYMALQRNEEAYQDYVDSLEIRRAAHESHPNDENQFQLARGYANLGSLVLATADDERLAKLEGDAGAEDREIKVLEEYVEGSIGLMKQLATRRFADIRPQTDYRRITNLAAELYFFAAMHRDQDAERRQLYLHKAEELAGKAIHDFEIPDDAGQNVQDVLASSYTILIQIARARESQVIADQSIQELAATVNELIDAEDKGNENLNGNQLSYRAIALAAHTTAENQARLRKVMEQMSKRGLSKDPRFQKHFRCFDDHEVKALVSSFITE